MGVTAKKPHAGGRGCISLKAGDISHVKDILTVGSRVMLRR